MDNKRLHSIPGFKPANVATMYLHLPGIRYPQIPSRRIFGRNCSRELMPSWAEAAMTRDLLPVGTYVYHRVLIDGQPTPGGESEPEVQTLSVRGNYFSAMHIPIRARRDVSAMDREAQPATGDRQRGVRPGQLVPNWSAQLESILNRARDETHEWMMIIGAAGKAS